MEAVSRLTLHRPFFSTSSLFFKPQNPSRPTSTRRLLAVNIVRGRRLSRRPSQNDLAAVGASLDVEERRRHRTRLVESYHYINNIKVLLADLNRKNSSPVGILESYGDWSQDQLRVAVGFLVGAGRAGEALQVFDAWMNKEIFRINVANYSKMIELLCDENLTEEAMLVFQDMEKHQLTPSLKIYNGMIEGFAKKKDFDKSKDLLKNMVETGVMPTAETYHGLIKAYGSNGMYDEMCKCLKRMESDGCCPNEVTYNILICEFAMSGVVDRMEGIYRTLLSKKMNLQASTLVAMLEAYANLGIVDKMEKFYRKVFKKNGYLKENLVRKVAAVYIENYRYSWLEELGNALAARTGRTDLVWCILLLACACFLSRKGIESVMQEMQAAKVELSVTYVNILALFYLKIKDFSALNYVLSRTVKGRRKPDIVTLGILFDACRIGFEGTHILEKWRRSGFLEDRVEMITDPLVLSAFGKGLFMRDCEKVFSSLGSNVQIKNRWRYGYLISLVFGNNGNVKGL